MTLTGAGQNVGLSEFDGFYASDIATYAGEAGNGRTTLSFNRFCWTAPAAGDHRRTAANTEVSLDIEMAMAMAPGLAKIWCLKAGRMGNQNDVLNAMAASNR